MRGKERREEEGAKCSLWPHLLASRSVEKTKKSKMSKKTTTTRPSWRLTWMWLRWLRNKRRRAWFRVDQTLAAPTRWIGQTPVNTYELHCPLSLSTSLWCVWKARFTAPSFLPTSWRTFCTRSTLTHSSDCSINFWNYLVQVSTRIDSAREGKPNQEAELES